MPSRGPECGSFFETPMHYKNGREAKQGDKVISLEPRNQVIGILHSLMPGSVSCNGRIAASNSNDPYITIGECLHIDDVRSALPPEAKTML